MNKSVTELLLDWRAGDEQALEALAPLVYEELRRLASKYMQDEGPGHTLQATALVHEAYARLVDMDISWQDRAHFFAVAARMMRRVLVDHARRKGRAKRGGGLTRLPLDEGLVMGPQTDSLIIDLDTALHKLSTVDDRAGRVVELFYFGGLTYDEAGEALGISRSTVRRELNFARAWLHSELNPAVG